MHSKVSRSQILTMPPWWPANKVLSLEATVNTASHVLSSVAMLTSASSVMSHTLIRSSPEPETRTGLSLLLAIVRQ